MRLPQILALAAGLSVGGTQVATAATDLLGPSTYCNSGQALVTCATFMITTADNGSGGTLVTIYIRNLAGCSACLDNTGGSFITKIGLANAVGSYVGGTFAVGTSGSVNVVGSPASKWLVGTVASELGVLTFLTKTGNPDKNGGIQGCSVISAPANYFQTCDPSYSGFVTFTFETDVRWYASDALIAYKTQGVILPTGQTTSLECISSPTDPKFNCDPPPPPDTPVPEPASITLLAIGLVGLGGAGLLRRRKRGNG